MATYNPYENDSDKFNPYEGEQPVAPGILQAAASFAKNMVVFGAVNIIGRVATRGISRGIGSFIKNYGSGSLANIAKQMATKGEVVSLGGIFAKTDNGKALNKLYSDATKNFSSALESRDARIKAAQQMGPASHAVTRITSAFKDMRTFSGTVGRAFKKTVWTGAGVAYAIDNAAGITRDMGIERKPLWDVPGQVGNFTKWLGVNTIYGLGFHGIPALAKAAGGTGALALRDSLKNNRPWVEKLMQGLQTVAPGRPEGPKANTFLKTSLGNIPRSQQGQTLIEKAYRSHLAFGDSVMSTLRTVESSVRQSVSSLKSSVTEKHPTLQRIRKSVTSPYKRALEDIKEIWSKKAQLKKQVDIKSWGDVRNSGLQAVEYLHNLASKEGIKASVGTKPKPGMDPIIQTIRTLNTKKTLLEEILPGLNAVRNKDSVNSHIWDVIDKYVQGAPKNSGLKEFARSVKNMRSSDHVYTGYGTTGMGVDLSIFDPLRTIRRVAAFTLDMPIGLGFGMNFTAGSLLHLDEFLQEKPKVHFFEKRPNLAGLTDISASDSTGLYVDGRFATFQNGKINSLNWGRDLRYSPKGGAFRDNEVIRMNKELRNLFGIKANRELDKFEKKGPWNSFVNILTDRLHMTLPGAMKSFFGGIQRVLSGKRDYVDAAKLFGISLKDFDERQWKKTMGVFGTIKEHAAQDILPIMKSKRFLEELGDSAAARLGLRDKSELFEIMNSDRALIDKLDVIKDKYKAIGGAFSKPDIQEAVEMIRAFPGKASRHAEVKPLGRLSAMTAVDKVRIGLIDDIFNSSLLDESNIGGSAKELLLVKAASKLRNKGLLTKNEEKAFKIHSFLSQFEGEVHKNTAKPDAAQTRRLLDFAKDKAKLFGLDAERDIIEYVSRTKMRRPPWQSAMENRPSQIPDFYKSNTPFISTPKDFWGAAYEYGDAVFNTVGNLLSSTLPFAKDKYDHFGIKGTLKYTASSIAKIAAFGMAIKTTDAFVAGNPLLDNTALEDGYVPFLADQIAKTRLASSRIMDATGITGVAKFVHGLMPGFESSAPGGIIGGAIAWKLGKGTVDKIRWFAGGVLANRILSPYLPDFTKSNDQLQAEYSGEVEVPMMKNPSWLLGMTPWEGSKVIGYKPNWYVQTKSRWKESDTLYGSTFRKVLHEPIWPLGISLGDIVDPYYMERKHYFSRPYPTSGGFGEEVPLIGPYLNATLGKIIKPIKTMHQEYLGGDEGTDAQDSPFAIAPPSVREGWNIMKRPSRMRSLGGMSSNFGTFVYSDQKTSAATESENFLYNVENFTGLAGFMSGAVSERFNTGPRVLPTLETAGRIASQSRAFYDMNLGGLGIFTEAIRRIIPKPPGDRYGINPIPNMFPNWLPGEYLTGDAYSKLIKGELRLPGSAYESTHTNLNKSMPARSSMIGFDTKHSVQYFTGLITPKLAEEMDILETGTLMHQKIQDSLAAEGLLIQAESLVYDVKNDISGHVDAIIRDGTGGAGKRALEIKTINAKSFSQLKGPKWEHVGQLNFYLKQLKMYRGTILYVNRENPSEVRTFEVKYSRNRFNKDIENLRKARQISANLMQEGVNDRFGYSYSWLDRLKILADVSPTSDEFKAAKSLVQQQIKYNLLSEKEIIQYQTALKHRQARVRQYELYPKRFAGRIMSPDTQSNIDSINEDIKAGAEYALPFRVVGAAWENFTNYNSFLTNKLFAFKDPLEHYKTYKLYGKEFQPWDEPYRSFIEPYTRKALSRTDPITAAVTWGIGASNVAGPIGGLVGGALGAMYGTVQGLRKIMGGNPYIPGGVKDQRAVEDYFDKLKYSRNMMMANLSEGLTRDSYLTAASSTLTAFMEGDQNVANLFRGASTTERPYIEGWLNVRDEDERNKILNFASPAIGEALKKQWSSKDNKITTSRYITNNSDPATFKRFNFDRSLMDPSMSFEDIKMKTVEDLGFDSHDFGLGWNDQIVRMQDQYNSINTAASEGTLAEYNRESISLNSGHVRQALTSALSGYSDNVRAQIYIHDDSQENFINITVRRDRSKAIINALDNRERYM